MAHSGSRLVLATFLILVAAFVGAGARLVQAPLVADAAGSETFTLATPPKVYSDIPTHTGVADANPTLGTTGYCVEVQNDNHAPPNGAPNNGFTISGGLILTTDVFLNGSGTTTDDVYCVVAIAIPNVTNLPRPEMIIRWTYLDSGLPQIAELRIKVVTVTLKGVNGVVGGAAQVCTDGWDGSFLTGKASNTPPGAPNQLDIVDVTDWSEVPGSPTVTELGVLRSGSEQCVNLTTNILTGVQDIDVTIQFYALFDLGRADDDRLITVTVVDVVDINKATVPELRHISQALEPGVGGQIIKERTAPPNVIGAIHTACVIPSVTQDTLRPEDVQFASDDGADAQFLRVFRNSGAFPDPEGVPSGTVCFSWASLKPGRQTIAVNMTLSIQNPANTTGSPLALAIGWDTDRDGNQTASVGGPLVKLWDTIDHTVINTASHWYDDDLTNTTVEAALQFNAADGKWLVGNGIVLKDWAVGHFVGTDGEIMPIDGVPMNLKITSPCGYFGLIPGTKEINPPPATTQNGQIQFTIDIFQDGSCHPGSVILLEIRARYPDSIHGAPAVAVERLAILLTFVQPESAPQVLWAGQTATISYGFSGDCPTSPVIFSREPGQPGTFLGSGTDEIETLFGENCTALVQYESEDPGFVNIRATVVGGNFTPVSFNLFFLVFEDLTLTTPSTDLTVSERSQLDGQVRGWFVGANPSARPQEKKADGRVLPAQRWILPDDWQLLKGPEDFRGSWPAEATMPPVRVTYFMENEGVRNNFKAGVKTGSAGFFLTHDYTEYFYNIHPDSFVPSVNGTPEKPRILSQDSDADGVTIVDFIGDLNLNYEGCAVNIATGNPHCKVGDIGGRSRFYLVVDYQNGNGLTLPSPWVHRGKWPAIRSNTLDVVYSWQGYKTVTWEPGEAPQFKYIVAHMKDRDGFCDAASYNNLLGIPIDFKIDAGPDGIIIQAQSQPSYIQPATQRFAVSTTYDTEDDYGAPMNAQLVKTVVSGGECQAWIKVSNSLLENAVNVRVTFPPPPPPMPGDIRITNAVCVPKGGITVTNVGQNPVSLAGFSLRSLNSGQPVNPEEYLGLEGFLLPGESKQFIADKEVAPWLYAGDIILGPGLNDYVRLVWEETTLSKFFCDPRTLPFPFVNPPLEIPTSEGTRALPDLVPDPFITPFLQSLFGGFWPNPVYHNSVFFGSELKTIDRYLPSLGYPPTNPYALDGEGEVSIDIAVPFGDEVPLLLSIGWNLVTAGNGTMPITRAIGPNMSKLIAIYEWDPITGEWGRFIPDSPAGVNTIDSIQAGRIYWVQTKESFTLTLPK